MPIFPLTIIHPVPWQAHIGLSQPIHQQPEPVYRASYCPEVELYGNHGLIRENSKVPPHLNETGTNSDLQQIVYHTPQKQEPQDTEDKSLTPKSSR